MRKISPLVIPILLTSCASLDFSKTDNGELGPVPNTVALQQAAERVLQDMLIDPESRRVRWFDEQPKKAAAFTGYLRSGWVYGWAMRFGVNAKNRMGGYTGEKLFYVMQHDGKVRVNEVILESHFAVQEELAMPAR